MSKRMGPLTFTIVFLAAALLTAGCGASATPTSALPPTTPLPAGPDPTTTQSPSPAPTSPPTLPPQITATETTLTEPVSSPTSMPAGVSPAEVPSAGRGQEVFGTFCAECHGPAGDGAGLPGAANFTDAAFVHSKTPAQFFVSIRDGVAGSAMPAWGEILDPMEIWDVVYYERSLVTSPQQIALGHELFAQNCVSCHGEAGDGSGLAGAANFTDLAFMSNQSPEQLFASISNGVPGSAMPAWGETLDDDQIWALVDYVSTFAYQPAADQ